MFNFHFFIIFIYKKKMKIEDSFLTPNPTDGKVNVHIPSGISATGVVYDLSGRNILQFVARPPETEIDLSSFSRGLYCVALQSEGTICMKKLIIN